MALTGFHLTRLALVGNRIPVAEVKFDAGLNVISGPSDTGKTFIVQCIDYMLGGSKLPKPIPESEQYDTVRLGLRRSGHDEEIVLERSIRGGDFKVYSEDQNDRPLSATHKTGKSDSVSYYLLGLSGLTGKRVRTNKQGVTREVSFRDIARLVLVDEETVISETSPILSGQYTTATVENAIFRLLLTGVDDSSLIASEDPKVAKGRQAGRTEMLEFLLNRAKEQLAELQLPGDSALWEKQLTQVESLYEAAQKELAVGEDMAAKLEEQRRAELVRLRKAESRVGVLRELQQRFELLEQQYQSDLRRLASIAEVGSRLDQMAEVSCPVCGALAEHQSHEHQKADQSPQDVAQSCLAEAGKIRPLLTDLQLTQVQNGKEIQALQHQCDQAKDQIHRVAAELTEFLKPRIEAALQQFQESQAIRDTYRHAVDLNGRVVELQGLLFEIGAQRPEKGATVEPVKVRIDEANNFCKEVESLLKAWHFPGLDRVTFSELDQDIVISGRKRASHGKGVRAIAHAAFNLALLRNCIAQGMPHPGFVLIDSPLVVYREPDTDEGTFSHDVKDAFYQSISEEFKTAQVIIFENEDPPPDICSSANVIRFTGARHGRGGFIPNIY